MELPKYHETFLQVLKTLNNSGQLKSRELASLVRDNYYSDLPKELLNQKTSSGANVLLDRILWSKSYLKMAKFVSYPRRAMVQITEKGRQVLKTGKLSLNDLKNDIDFRNHRKSVKIDKDNEPETKTQTISVENDSPQDLIDS